MQWSGFSGRLGFRLGSLLSLAILPIGLISIVQTLHLSREAERSTEIALQGRTAAAAAGERALLQSAVGTADALGSSILTLVDDADACSEMLRQYVARSATYIYAAFVTMDGLSACSSRGTTADVSHSQNYRTFLEYPSTLVTSTMRGPVTGAPVVIVSQPLYRDADLLGYVALSMSQDLLRSAHMAGTGPDGADEARILTFNRHGQPLMLSGGSDDIDDALPQGETLETLVARANTSFRGRSAEGETRVFSVVPVVPDLVYALGSWSPKVTGLAGLNVSRFTAVLFPLALWAVSLAVAYFAVYRLVLQHIRELRGQMRRFALGDRSSAPPILIRAPGEIRDVSETFHNMARILIRDEAAMEAAVAEKTVLLKEVHHRVKNNLQLIASIINMQSRVIDDADAKRVLRSVQDRVASLATIYKNLYQAEHLDSVEADRLIRDIIGQMTTAGVLNHTALRIDTELQPLTLQPDQAVPLTLLTTEAFTNALKYAGAPSGDVRPWVKVRLTLGEDGMAELCIENTLGGPRDDEDSTGLGSQLIEAFAMQLDSEVEIDADAHHYRISLRFRPQRGAEVADDLARTVVFTSAARVGAQH